LAALGCVDWVVPFSEDTPQRLIEAVLPDVLVKGGDYTVSQVAGSDAVLANGGEVKMLDFVDGLSTSKLLEKLKQLEAV
jgi:D-beta-D-heptose 7-phosphate kinase / D-beta-D-heptose 1-phosphate adenosyltransferase